MVNSKTENIENKKYSLKNVVEASFENETLYQIAVIVMLSYNAMYLMRSHSITSFYIYTPNFACKGSNLSACDPNCTSGVEFDPEYKTVVTEWELICDKRYLTAVLNTLYFCGVGLGAFLGGTLADIYGRKTVTFTCVFTQGALGASLFFVARLDLFVGIRFVQGFFVQAIGSSNIALATEFSSRRYRPFITVILHVFTAIGLVYLAAGNYVLRDWRWVQLYVALPLLLNCVFVWIVPESPRWLLSKGRNDQAIKICKKVDKTFDYTPETETMVASEEETDAKTGYMEIFKNPILRKHLLFNSMSFFTVCLTDMGTFFFLQEVSGERHLNYLITALVALVTSYLTFLILKKYGRVRPMAAFQLIPAALMASIGLLSQFASNQQWTGVAISFIAQAVRMFINAGFTTAILQTSELFPTVCRGNGYGLCSLSCRIGYLLAPQMMFLAERTSTPFAMLLYTISLTVSGIGTTFLPETHNKKLPNTIEEANLVWGKNKFELDEDFHKD